MPSTDAAAALDQVNGDAPVKTVSKENKTSNKSKNRGGRRPAGATRVSRLRDLCQQHVVAAQAVVNKGHDGIERAVLTAIHRKLIIAMRAHVAVIEGVMTKEDLSKGNSSAWLSPERATPRILEDDEE